MGSVRTELQDTWLGWDGLTCVNSDGDSSREEQRESKLRLGGSDPEGEVWGSFPQDLTGEQG